MEREWWSRGQRLPTTLSRCVTRVAPSLHQSSIKKSSPKTALSNGPMIATYSAAIRTSGAAARTSASTCFSYFTKFSWNMRTSLRAVSSKAALSFQVFIG